MHFLRIVFGFLAATLTAAFTAGGLWALIFSKLEWIFKNADHLPVSYYGQGFDASFRRDFALIFFGTLIFTGIPTAILVALSEALSWRRLWPQLLCGATIGLGIAFIFRPMFLDKWYFVFASCGILSAFMYWLVAGRHAGKWQRV